MQHFDLIQLNTRLNVYRLPADSPIPDHIWQAEFVSVTRTLDEVSIVASEDADLTAENCSPDWVALKVKGPLPHDMVGVMAELSACIANAGCSIFAIATFDTDYILVNSDKLDLVRAALQDAGHRITQAN